MEVTLAYIANTGNVEFVKEVIKNSTKKVTENGIAYYIL